VLPDKANGAFYASPSSNVYHTNHKNTKVCHTLTRNNNTVVMQYGTPPTGLLPCGVCHPRSRSTDDDVADASVKTDLAAKFADSAPPSATTTVSSPGPDIAPSPTVESSIHGTIVTPVATLSRFEWFVFMFSIAAVAICVAIILGGYLGPVAVRCDDATSLGYHQHDVLPTSDYHPGFTMIDGVTPVPDGFFPASGVEFFSSTRVAALLVIALALMMLCTAVFSFAACVVHMVRTKPQVAAPTFVPSLLMTVPSPVSAPPPAPDPPKKSSREKYVVLQHTGKYKRYTKSSAVTAKTPFRRHYQHDHEAPGGKGGGLTKSQKRIRDAADKRCISKSTTNKPFAFFIKATVLMMQIDIAQSADVVIGALTSVPAGSSGDFFSYGFITNCLATFALVWAIAVLFDLPTPARICDYSFHRIVLFAKRCNGHAQCQAKRAVHGLKFRCHHTTSQLTMKYVNGLNLCTMCLPSSDAQAAPDARPGYNPVPESEPDASEIGVYTAFVVTAREVVHDVWHTLTVVSGDATSGWDYITALIATHHVTGTMISVLGPIAGLISAVTISVAPGYLWSAAANACSCSDWDVVVSALTAALIVAYFVFPANTRMRGLKSVVAVCVLLMIYSLIGTYSADESSYGDTGSAEHINSTTQLTSDVYAAALGVPIAAFAAATQQLAPKPFSPLATADLNVTVAHDDALASSFMFDILPDTGANVSAVPNESYLMSVESRQRLGVDNVGPQSGVSVATGTMRVEFTDVHGNKYQRDLPGVHVIPSMKRVVMGNNCELAGIQWDSMQRRIVLSPTSAERANNNAPADVSVTRRNWLYQLPVRILRRADPVLPRSAPMTDAEIWEYATNDELRCLDEKRAASSWRSTTNTPPPVPDDAERLQLWRQAAELQHRETLDDDDELTFSDTTLPMCEPTPILFAEYFEIKVVKV
jgi:hypothetical protein